MEGKNAFCLESKIGNFKIDKEQILTFDEGPLGFKEYSKFVILEDENDSIFLWLQSIDAKNVAFPILEVELLGNSSDKFIDKTIKEQLNVQETSCISVYSIISVNSNIEQITANIKAPIIINNTNKKGIQYVMPNPDLEIAKPVFKELRERLASTNGTETCNISSLSIRSKRTNINKEKIINS